MYRARFTKLGINAARFKGKFAKIGIEIHDLRYGSWWSSPAHQGASDAYNRAWDNFFARYGNRLPSQAATLSFGRNLARSYGLRTNF